jgi:transposase
MPNRIDFTLRADEVRALETAIKTDKRTGVVRRATAVRLLHMGYKVTEVAEMVSVSEPILYQWHARFRGEGVEGLAHRKRVQPRRKVTDEYMRLLEEAIAKEPGDVGYPFALWTRARLLAHLEAQTGIRIDVSWLQKLLNQLGYVCRRPKHDLTHRQDAVAKAQAAEELETLKKSVSMTISGSSLWTKQP